MVIRSEHRRQSTNKEVLDNIGITFLYNGRGEKICKWPTMWPKKKGDKISLNFHDMCKFIKITGKSWVQIL